MQNINSTTIMDLKNLKCDKCQSETFTQGFILKEVPSILSEDGKPGLIPIPVFICANCGHVNDKYNPLKQPNINLNNQQQSSLIT